MISPERIERVHKNDGRVAELLPQLTNPNLLEIFGLQELEGVPKGIRQRVRRTLGNTTLSKQAWQLVGAGKHEEARRVFEECLQRGAKDLADERFFSVYWGLGKLDEQRGDKASACTQYLTAIDAYPDRAREEHYVVLIELMLVDPRNETIAAAMVQRALVQLGVNKETLDSSSDQLPGRQLLALSRQLEMRRTPETRPAFPASYLA